MAQTEEGLKLAFKHFDKDSDGLLTLEEITSALKYMGHEVNQEQIRESTGSEKVNFEQFVEILNRTRPEHPDPIRQSWLMFDTDADGFITIQELKLALVKLGEYLPPGEAEKILESVDSDHDGTISFEEFKIMMGQTTQAPQQP